MNTIVYRWRLFCNTENDWVYLWSENTPTTCPNNTGDVINTSSIQLVDQVQVNDVNIVNMSQSPFLDNIVVIKNPIIDLKSFYPLSNVRDKIVGDIVRDISEIKISTTTATDSVSCITSMDRGVYVAGTICEAGIAVRIPVALVGTQTLKFGYFDADNGFYFKVKAGGVLCCCILDNSIETEIQRADFNMYKLDGTESVGVNLDFAKGNIFQIRFSWYGYGAVQFGVIANGPDNIQKVFPFHRYFTNGHTSTKNPNLPINTALENNGETTVRSVYLAGRQYSIFGGEPIKKRVNMYYVRDVSVSGSFGILFSLLKATNLISCRVQITKVIIKSNVDVLVQILHDTTLTGSSFGSNPYATETALQIDTSSTSYTGGEIVFGEMIFADEMSRTIDTAIDVFENNISIVVKRLGTSITGEFCSLVLKYAENW